MVYQQWNYLGTFEGNDTLGFLDTVEENLFNFAGIDTELTQATVSYTTTDETNGDVLGTYTGPDGDDVDNASRTGTWTALPAPTTTISFYSVKAGKYYSLYQLLPEPQATGSWSTYDMWHWGQENGMTGLGGGGGLEVSHFSGFNPGVAAVPEPTTMLLFGTGLAGLAAVRRKRKQ